MCTEIISISSSDGDDSTIKEVQPLSPVKAEPSEVGAPSAAVNRIIHANDLDTFLHVKQTKHSAYHMKKYECRICACGCSFCLNLLYDATEKTACYMLNLKLV
jgi:hypothetical protein